MKVQEIKVESLQPQLFVNEKINDIKSIVGDNLAINALSGGVDSSTVTMLGNKALGANLKTYFIDNGMMRQDEPELVASVFKQLGVQIEIIDAKEQFLQGLKGIAEPEKKRETVSRIFYEEVFGKIVKESGAKFLLQGTNYTDLEETVTGIKRQHNVLRQLGIDTQAEFGYKVIEPIIQLRKSAVRSIARFVGLPKEISTRPPFPGLALAARIIGEVTQEKIDIARAATKIVEDKLSNIGAFEYLAILHGNRVTGIRDGKQDFGRQIEIRCWQSKDALIAQPSRLPYEILDELASEITKHVPDIVSVLYNITKKPPSMIEAV